MITRNRCAAALALFLLVGSALADSPSYEDLQQLFADWRTFESPPLLDGAPDYTVGRFAAREPEFDVLRQQVSRSRNG